MERDTEVEGLLPCPFCGRNPRRYVSNDILHVECPTCVSVGFHNHARFGCIADYEWNNRAEAMEKLPARVIIHMEGGLGEELEQEKEKILKDCVEPIKECPWCGGFVEGNECTCGAVG